MRLDCTVPTRGLKWRTFDPLVYLPMWQPAPDPGPQAPFTSVTHWTWDELAWQGRFISVSNRAAYLEYLDVPRLPTDRSSWLRISEPLIRRVTISRLRNTAGDWPTPMG
jgi:hypothetical protein